MQELDEALALHWIPADPRLADASIDDSVGFLKIANKEEAEKSVKSTKSSSAAETRPNIEDRPVTRTLKT